MFLSQMEANQRYHARQVRGQQNAEKARMENARRIFENPTPTDISRGDALNSALDVINNPKVYLRGLKGTQAKVSPALIRDVPFQYAAAAITTSVYQIVHGGPPDALKTEAFTADREEFKKVGKQIREQIDEGEKIDPDLLKQAEEILTKVRAKVEDTYAKNTPQRRDSEKFLKSVYGLIRMLEQPQYEFILADVEKHSDATLGDLIGFMQVFNLRFGATSNPRQREVYNTLYPLLVKLRDEALAGVSPSSTPAPPPPGDVRHPGEVFGNMDYNALERKKGSTPPANPPK
jgi:hypothetical protein